MAQGTSSACAGAASASCGDRVKAFRVNPKAWRRRTQHLQCSAQGQNACRDGGAACGGRALHWAQSVPACRSGRRHSARAQQRWGCAAGCCSAAGRAPQGRRPRRRCAAGRRQHMGPCRTAPHRNCRRRRPRRLRRGGPGPSRRCSATPPLMRMEPMPAAWPAAVAVRVQATRAGTEPQACAAGMLLLHPACSRLLLLHASLLALQCWRPRKPRDSHLAPGWPRAREEKRRPTPPLRPSHTPDAGTVRITGRL